MKPYTDDDWDPTAGGLPSGLPEPARNPAAGFEFPAAGLRSDTCRAGAPGIAGGFTSVTGGRPLEHVAPHHPGGITIAGFGPPPVPSTITPPPRAEDPDDRRHREVMTVLKLIGEALEALSEGLAEVQAAINRKTGA